MDSLRMSFGWRKLPIVVVAAVALVAGLDAQGRPETTASQLVRVAHAAATRGDGLDVLQLRPNFYLIAGAGGNIGVQVGPDGLVVVDSGNAARASTVVAAIRALSSQPIRYVINTSADPDHVGGNDELSAAGQSVIPTGGLNEIGAAGGRSPILAEE